MSAEGFLAILDELSPAFSPLREMAKLLHGLLFSLRDGKTFTGTDTEPAAVERLYDGMATAKFYKSALLFQMWREEMKGSRYWWAAGKDTCYGEWETDGRRARSFYSNLDTYLD